jgi:hypothetical protein
MVAVAGILVVTLAAALVEVTLVVVTLMLVGLVM